MEIVIRHLAPQVAFLSAELLMVLLLSRHVLRQLALRTQLLDLLRRAAGLRAEWALIQFSVRHTILQLLVRKLGEQLPLAGLQDVWLLFVVDFFLNLVNLLGIGLLLLHFRLLS